MVTKHVSRHRDTHHLFGQHFEISHNQPLLHHQQEQSDLSPGVRRIRIWNRSIFCLFRFLSQFTYVCIRFLKFQWLIRPSSVLPYRLSKYLFALESIAHSKFGSLWRRSWKLTHSAYGFLLGNGIRSSSHFERLSQVTQHWAVVPIRNKSRAEKVWSMISLITAFSSVSKKQTSMKHSVFVAAIV